MCLIDFRAQLDSRFKKKVLGHYEGYQFQVGVLKDKPHYAARPASRGLGTLQGGPVRKTNRQKKYGTVARVSESLRKRFKGPSGGNIYTDPFRRSRSKDMRAFLRAFNLLVSGKTKNYGAVEAALRAVVRNPILRRTYGANSAVTRKIKTFDRLLIDTGQFFKAITAKVRKRVQS